jgi:DNA-binding MarR family transcriptional regulator
MGILEHAPATVAQVARALGLARQSVQRVADLLEADGIAEYVPNPADRRADLLQLTENGRAALQTIQKAQRTWADALGAEIGEDELRRTSEVLRKAMEAVVTREAGAI